MLGLRREGGKEGEREGEKESSVCIFYSFLIRSCFFPAQVLFSSLSLPHCFATHGIFFVGAAAVGGMLLQLGLRVCLLFCKKLRSKKKGVGGR